MDWGINFMFVKSKRKTSLLQYWTTRYFLILIIGLFVMSIISVYWIKYNTNERRLEIVNLLAEDISREVIDNNGQIILKPDLSKVLDRKNHIVDLHVRAFILILDHKNNIIYSQPDHFPNDLLQKIPLELNATNQTFTWQFPGDRSLVFHIVEREIIHNNSSIGRVVLLYPEADITVSKDQLKFLVMMLGSIALLGWGVIYLLTKKLSEPIKEVAEAANQIVHGNYDIVLKKDLKEKEMSDLVQSFKDMADRLQQLEIIRAELLAGVTHELKTPVASMSGLIQAVKDDVVTGEEAKEFLDICHKETNKLQKMVEDLLDFNSFVVGAVKVNKEKYDIKQLVQEITYQWSIMQDDESVTLNNHFPENNLTIFTDAVRVQQILYNLLNNSKQAMKEQGKGNIDVYLYELEEVIKIDVKDNGIGISEEEQSLIFERYYRGNDKKHAIRGLGLGLTFSKMLATALGGDLLLKESSKAGTIFTFILPKSID